MTALAPVIIFVYCRKDLTQQLIHALEKNKYIKRTELYLYADIPLRPSLKPLSDEVIHYITEYAKVSPFYNVHIKVAKRHKGLASSVIDGVTEVIQKHGKVIVLEDDLLISENFLEFMQKALHYYKNNSQIWSITGNTEDLPSLSKYRHSVYMSYKGNSLGWGTWKDRWSEIDWQVRDYADFQHNPIKRFLFNRSGNNMSLMLDKQMKDKSYDSWAIRFCYQQFKLHKLTVYPKETRVIHLGNDTLSTHGKYVSTMHLKEHYQPCKFENLAVDKRLHQELRRAYSTPPGQLITSYFK